MTLLVPYPAPARLATQLLARVPAFPFDALIPRELTPTFRPFTLAGVKSTAFTLERLPPSPMIRLLLVLPPIMLTPLPARASAVVLFATPKASPSAAPMAPEGLASVLLLVNPTLLLRAVTARRIPLVLVLDRLSPVV